MLGNQNPAAAGGASVRLMITGEIDIKIYIRVKLSIEVMVAHIMKERSIWSWASWVDIKLEEDVNKD